MVFTCNAALMYERLYSGKINSALLFNSCASCAKSSLQTFIQRVRNVI